MGISISFVRLSENRRNDLATRDAAWAELDSDHERLYAEWEARGITPYPWGNKELGFSDLDLAWDRLHFLLDPRRREGGYMDPGNPEGAAIVGWHPMPTLRGPDYEARYNTPAEVVEIADALSKVDFDEALDLHMGSMGTRVYRSGADTPFLRDYLRQWFDSMRNFYAEAARLGQAVITERG